MNSPIDVRATPVCRRVDDEVQWRELQPHWDRLLQRSAESTPWQGWDHLRIWWRHLGGDRLLRIYVVEAAGQPVLLLPLQISRSRHGPFTVRWLEPLGMMEEINRPHLGLGSADAEMWCCALSAVWSDRAEWDALRIDERPPADAEVDLLRDFAGAHGLHFDQLPFHDCPRLDLAGGWEAFQKGRSSKLKKNLRASRRELEKSGEVRLQIYTSPEEIDVGMDHMLAIQRFSWKHEQGIGLSRSPAYQAYYLELLKKRAERDGARIMVLFCGELPVAATIAVMEGRSYFSAYIAHDQRFGGASPGTLLESLEFEELFSGGRYVEYDFLGAALNNKRRWTDTARTTCRVVVTRPSLGMRLLHTWWLRLKPGWKALRRRAVKTAEAAPPPGHYLPF